MLFRTVNGTRHDVNAWARPHTVAPGGTAKGLERRPVPRFTELSAPENGSREECLQVWNAQALNLLGLKLRQATRISPAATRVDVLVQPGHQARHCRSLQSDTWIQAMRDVDVPRMAAVQSELRRSASHICAEDRRRRLEAHRPPRLAMLRDIALVGTPLLCPGQERADTTALLASEFIELARQVNDAAQGFG